MASAGSVAVVWAWALPSGHMLGSAERMMRSGCSAMIPTAGQGMVWWVVVAAAGCYLGEQQVVVGQLGLVEGQAGVGVEEDCAGVVVTGEVAADCSYPGLRR